MKKIKKYFNQKEWYRNIKGKTCFKSKGLWYDISELKKGMIVEDVENGCGTMAWCKCGNELVHSNSFIKEREVTETNFAVFDYKCSYCGKEQHWNPCLIPGLIPCDKSGIPLI